MVDPAPTDPAAGSSPPAPRQESRLRTWLVGGGIIALVVLFLWPAFRRVNPLPLDSARWRAHEGRDAMVADVVQKLDDGKIWDESTAEAHLGKPDRRERNSRDERAWWYYLDSRGRLYLRVD